jgi:hypothetical protein
MIDQVRKAAQKTKRFAQEHQTITACAVTAVVSWKMSKAVTMRHVGEQLSDAIELTYEFGKETGVLRANEDHYWDFLASMGLVDKWIEFQGDLAKSFVN